LALKFPKTGCFVAAYPSPSWRETPCVQAPPRGTGPIRVPPGTKAPRIIRHDLDVFAGAPSPISWAEGSFPTIIDLTSAATNNSPGVYSLQLNSGTFTTTACKNAKPGATCTGWAQFVVDTSTVHSYALIEYWVRGFANPCADAPTLPNIAGTTTWFPFDSDCGFESPSIQMPPLSVADLGAITVRGTADAQGNDTIVVTHSDGTFYGASFPDATMQLAAGWTSAEYNIFGYAGGQEAVLNEGAALVGRIKIEDGSTSAPTLQSMSLTGETNNLTLATPGCASAGSPPSVEYEEAYFSVQLSHKCPPTPKAYQPFSCTVLQEGVTTAEKLLAIAQSKLKTPPCTGGLSIECEKQVQMAEQSVTAAEAQYKMYCSNQ
jgi:hypothetical protein